MAKIFYCGGLASRLAMLRAVIPVDELSFVCGLLSHRSEQQEHECDIAVRIRGFKMTPSCAASMSLVVAVSNKDSIVLAADTICLIGSPEAHYLYDDDFSKIFPLRNPKFGVGVAGSSTAEQFVEIGQSSNTFNELVGFIRGAVSKRYDEKQLDYEMTFLFCGFGADDKPFIETLSFDGSCRTGRLEEVSSKIGKAAIGICKHGALYIIHSFHNLEMTTEQLGFLAYFALRETILDDERTRGPVELAVLRPHSPMTLYSPEQKRALEAAYSERKERVRNALTEPVQGLCTRTNGSRPSQS